MSSPQDVIVEHVNIGPDLIDGTDAWVGACTCGWRGTTPAETADDWRREHAVHQFAALIDAGYTIARFPEVAHKGPHDTDAALIRRAGENLAAGYPVGGQHVTAACAALLIAAAQAVTS